MIQIDRRHSIYSLTRGLLTIMSPTEIENLIRILITLNSTLISVSFAAFSFIRGRWDTGATAFEKKLEDTPPNNLHDFEKMHIQYSKALWVSLSSGFILVAFPSLPVIQIYLYYRQILTNDNLLIMNLIIFWIASLFISITVLLGSNLWKSQ